MLGQAQADAQLKPNPTQSPSMTFDPKLKLGTQPTTGPNSLMRSFAGGL